MLGSVVATSLYRVACEGKAPALVAGMLQSVLFNVPFCIGSVYLALKVHDKLARAAFLMLAIEQAILAYGALSGTASNHLLVGIPMVLFAALLTLLGIRHTTPRRAALIAPSAFVAMFLFSWGARYYGDVLMGRVSVVDQIPIC
ncbi:MAG TPA: hypothetical protein VFO67_09995 [Gemmatimonadales bacterium]|nr:hypothetical protein [Gemmatimonadales bacterium]